MATDDKPLRHRCDKQTKMLLETNSILSLMVATKMATNRRSFNPQGRPMLLASAHNINNFNNSSNSKDRLMRKYFSNVWRMSSGQRNKLTNKPTPYVKGRGNKNAWHLTGPVSSSVG